MSPFQSGFRAGHSTVSAVTLVLDNIVTAIDKKMHCAALFVDLSKAFDTLDHHLLLERLHEIGFDYSTCSWFRDYLSDRQQSVKLGSYQTEFLTVTNGVPQGSILGPVLFTIYINNIVSSLLNCHAHLYADDTVLYCISDSVQQSVQNLQSSFNTLQNCLVDLRLVLNTEKTKYMCFSRARITHFNDLIIHTNNGSHIERVTEYKYLGIWIDEKLSFTFHIKNLVCRLRQKIGYFYRNKATFPLFSRKRIIEAVFMSVLDYGDVVYRHASRSCLKLLDSVFHSALRFITGDAYDTHHCVLYEKVGWSSLKERRDAHWHIFIYKALTGKLPPYLTEMLLISDGLYQTRSTDMLMLYVPYARSELGKTAFSHSAPDSWNSQHTIKINTLITVN